MKKILKNVLFQILTFIITIGTIGMTYAAWTTLSSTQGATGQPVNQALIQGIINNLNDLNTRLTILETSATINGSCNNTTQYACSAGTSASNVAGSCGGSSTWSCLGSGGGSSASCSKANAACGINGSCGGSNNTCTTGSPSGYSAGSCGGSSSWSCLGSGGGSSASCGIANAACGINGSCGGSNNTCTTGSPSGYSAGSCGGSSSWTCLGSGGGSSASCSKVNAACPPPPWIGNFGIPGTTLTMTQTNASMNYSIPVCLLEKSTGQKVQGFYNYTNKTCLVGAQTFSDAIDILPVAAWINYYGTVNARWTGGSPSIAGNGSWSGTVPFASSNSWMLTSSAILNSKGYSTSTVYNLLLNLSPMNGTIVINSATYSSATDSYSVNYTNPIGVTGTLTLFRQ